MVRFPYEDVIIRRLIDEAEMISQWSRTILRLRDAIVGLAMAEDFEDLLSCGWCEDDFCDLHDRFISTPWPGDPLSQSVWTDVHNHILSAHQVYLATCDRLGVSIAER